MASDSYKIKVMSISENEVNLELQIVSPEEYYFYQKTNFVLQILWDSAQGNGDEAAAINKNISMNERLDEDWVTKNSDQFIESIEVKKFENYPSQQEFKDMSSEDLDKFRKNHGTPVAEYEVKLTDKKWIGHLSVGKIWVSTAYDMEV